MAYIIQIRPSLEGNTQFYWPEAAILAEAKGMLLIQIKHFTDSKPKL